MPFIKRLFILCLPLFAAACISPVDYGKIPHSQYVADNRCDPSAKPEGSFAGKPFFLVTSRLPDCRSADISLLKHRGDQVRYGRFADPLDNISNGNDDSTSFVPLALAAPQQWWADLATAMQSSDGRVLLYVHGYKETFFTSARDSAQISRMSDLNIPMVHYSWPSQGELFKYAGDETNMYWDQRNFRKFLMRLAQQPWTKEIILVSHSLGARLVIPAVEYVDRNSSNMDSSNISNIIMASPDVDTQDFERDIAEEVLSARRVNNDRRITVYVSAKDRALGLSYNIHGYPRLGRPDCFSPFKAKELKNEGYPERCYAAKSNYDAPPEKSGLTIVDTTAISGDRTGHTDYLKSAEGCADFAAVVRGNRKGSAIRQETRLSHVFTLPAPPKGQEQSVSDVCKRN